MAFNPKDVTGFPPPADPPRTIDFQSLCDLADSSQEVPVGYAFGGNAPNAVSIGNGNDFQISNPEGCTRIFVEFAPYAWNKNSPDWDGHS